MKSEIESQDSNDKMESPETDSSGTGEKTGEKSIRQKRDSTISFRVSRSQRERIKSLADDCGMSLSDYVLSRAYGYDPKPRLTPVQEDVRRELIIARSDYARYTAMLNSMPQEERKAMFRNSRWMGETLRLLGVTAERITRVLKRYFSANRIPAAGTMEKDNKTDES